MTPPVLHCTSTASSACASSDRCLSVLRGLCALLCCRCDLSDRRAISTADGERLAKEYGIAFYETSAKQDVNVQEAFGHLVKLVSDRLFSEGKGGAGTGGAGSGAVDINTAGDKKKGCC